jgi:hypothetical protein
MKPASPLVTDEALHIARAVAALDDLIAMNKATPCLPMPHSVQHSGKHDASAPLVGKDRGWGYCSADRPAGAQ